jgi:hypothetical protein
MSMHKIQSNSSALDLHLDPVPKMLLALKSTWAPESYVISFKLETDPDLVIAKARGAIAKYHVNMVIANQLQVRLIRIVGHHRCLFAILLCCDRLEKTLSIWYDQLPRMFLLSQLKDLISKTSSKMNWFGNAFIIICNTTASSSHIPSNQMYLYLPVLSIYHSICFHRSQLDVLATNQNKLVWKSSLDDVSTSIISYIRFALQDKDEKTDKLRPVYHHALLQINNLALVALSFATGMLLGGLVVSRRSK